MKPSNLLIRTAAAVVAELRRRPFLRMASTRVGAGDIGMQGFQGKFNAMPGTIAAPQGMGANPGVYGMRAVVANAGTVNPVSPGTAFGSTKASFTEYIWSFIWNYIDAAYDDNEAHQYWSSNLMDAQSFRAQVQGICDDIEREAFRSWLGGAQVFQDVGTNGFADSDANFESEWDTGLAVALANNGAVGDLVGLINPADHGNLKGVTGVRAADARGDMDAARRFDVQLFDGVMWMMCNNIPAMADSFSGTVTVKGVVAADATTFTYDGANAVVKAGALMTLGTATRYLATHVEPTSDGGIVTVHKALTAIADNQAVTGINDQVSLVASKRCLGHAPALVIPDAADPDYVVLQDMGTAEQPGTGMGCAIERNRATVARSNYIFSAALAAGAIDGKGVGVLVPS